jgi:hypothetical protein
MDAIAIALFKKLLALIAYKGSYRFSVENLPTCSNRV